MSRLSSPRTKYRNRYVNRAGLSAGIIGIFFILLIIIRIAAPSALAVITQPLWNVGTSLSNIVSGTFSLDSKIALHQQLQQQATKMASLQIENAALATQVADLTQLLGTRTEPEKGIVAYVTARPPVAPYDILIIDQGTTAGVTLGALAYGPGGTPVGTIGETDKRQSRITLFSTHGISSNGWVGATNIPVTLVGASAGAFTASLPKAAGVAVGDSVYLGVSAAVPIGTVTNIETDPSSPNVALDVHPYINPFSITMVTVAK